MSGPSRTYETKSLSARVAHRVYKSLPTPVGHVVGEPCVRVRTAFVIGVMASCAFVSLAAINLSVQGLYYDEIHQTPAAFAYLGKYPPFFASAYVKGKPLMTMSYSGAIKSAVYGLYMRHWGAPFAVESWRWLGIMTVAVTFPLFSVLASKRLSAAGLCVFFALLLTDTTVLLGTRHDWGPAALALALRMIFLGTWLYGQWQRGGAVPARNSFHLGALVGFSIYEKLSNLVLLLPLALFMFGRDRRSFGHWRACFLGGLVGALPLLYANGLNVLKHGRLLSTSQVAVSGAKTLSGLAELAREYLALGDGTFVRGFILGDVHGFAVTEAVLLSIALLATLGLWQSGSTSRLPALLVACYLVVAIGIFLLPNKTGPHHWVIGTPFQYLALAMAIGQSNRPPKARPAMFFASRAAVAGAVFLLLCVRVHGSFDVSSALARGDSSPIWDPSLTRLGEFAAKRAGKDLFVAGNWGVATQILCLSNGHPSVVKEIFEIPPDARLDQLLDIDRFRYVYLVLRVPQLYPDPQQTQKVITAFEEHPKLREVRAEPELAGLTGVSVRKFVRSNPETD
jgi:hypothetical protein